MVSLYWRLGQQKNIEELLLLICKKHPQLKTTIFEEGILHPFINIFVDGVNVKQLDGKNTRLDAGNEVRLVAAIAGG